MKAWNKPYPTKRLRLLNAIRKFHANTFLDGSTLSYNRAEETKKVIEKLNLRIDHDNPQHIPTQYNRNQTIDFPNAGFDS